LNRENVKMAQHNKNAQKWLVNHAKLTTDFAQTSSGQSQDKCTKLIRMVAILGVAAGSGGEQQQGSK